MKVLFLTYSQSPYRVDFFEELGKLVDLTVCFETLPKEDNKKKKRNPLWYNMSHKNYKALYLKNFNILNKRISFGLIKLIKKNDYSIIVVGSYSSLTAILTMEYMKIHNIPFIISIDGGFPNYNESKIKYLIKKHYISMASYFLSPGINANKYLTYYGANKQKIFIYPFTSMHEKDLLNNCTTKDEKEKLRKKLGLENTFTFISVGQFIYRKGMDVLIKAANNLNNSQIIIIGDKPKEEYLEIIRDNKINNVKIIDFKPKNELIEYLKAADVFVLATREDIWGLVVNEALSLGLPVITTTKCGAGLDLIKNGENGFLVNTDSIEDLQKKMLFYINNQIKLKEHSLNSLKYIKNYTIEKEARVHYELFIKISNNYKQLKKRK